MATHSSTLAWKIPWTEGPGGLQSMESLGVGHDWATSLYFFTFMHWRRKWQPTPMFLPGESQGRGSLVGCRLWVTQSRTRLKRLSSSSSSCYWVNHFLTLHYSAGGWGTGNGCWKSHSGSELKDEQGSRLLEASPKPEPHPIRNDTLFFITIFRNTT